MNITTQIIRRYLESNLLTNPNLSARCLLIENIDNIIFIEATNPRHRLITCMLTDTSLHITTILTHLMISRLPADQRTDETQIQCTYDLTDPDSLPQILDKLTQLITQPERSQQPPAHQQETQDHKHQNATPISTDQTHQT